MDSLRRSPRDGGVEGTFQALGTQCRMLLSGPASTAARALESAVLWVAGFEAKYSRFLPTSLVSRINAAAGREPVALDPESEHLFGLCHELHFLSRGLLDPTALPLLQLWNWKANPPALPTDAQIEAARSLVGWKQVRRSPGCIFLPRPGMGLDLGGMGKEYAVDQVTLLLLRSGVPGALVDFGADIRVFGAPPDQRLGWHIGL
ncbi:MAG: FAD:protein FMN transferase, partial [Verrucomicrobiae bacterium]|nr:FAD:protein FMN transferase [Verrucomicrobiae bacterium]